jgi:hypothetical protein
MLAIESWGGMSSETSLPFVSPSYTSRCAYVNGFLCWTAMTSRSQMELELVLGLEHAKTSVKRSVEISVKKRKGKDRIPGNQVWQDECGIHGNSIASLKCFRYGKLAAKSM